MLSKQIFSQKMQENLINDLMDLAKLENNKFTIKREYFSLPKMIKNSLDIMIGIATENGINLSAMID